MMKKSFSLLVLAIFLCFGLTGCRFLKPSFADEPKVAESLTVYDAEDKEILRTENKDVIDRFNNRLEGKENTDESSDEAVDLPEDAKVAYRIVYSTELQLETNFLVYENYDIITFTDAPFVDEMHFEVDAEFVEWLRHPEEWE